MMLPIPLTPEMVAMISQAMALNRVPTAMQPSLPGMAPFSGTPMMPSSQLPMLMTGGNNYLQMSPQQAMLAMQACYQQMWLMGQVSVPAPQAAKCLSLPQSPCPPATVLSPSGKIGEKRKSSEGICTEPAKRAASPQSAPAPLPDTSAISSAAPTTPIIASASSSSDADEDEFVDVVGDVGPKSREQRKSHIEFYRKAKNLRNRGDFLTCALCSESVPNIDNTIKTHITTHAKVSCLVCKLCGNTNSGLHQMFNHMATCHPKSAHNQYEDKRDMIELCELVTKCFPKNPASKGKMAHVELLNRLVANVKSSEAGSKISCAICNFALTPKKDVIMKHITSHHPFRCKKCKHIEHHEKDIVEHLKTIHQVEAPRMTTHFHVSAASEAIVVVIKRCFGAYLPDADA